MIQRFVLSLALFAFAANAATYKVTLSQTSTLKGTELKAGEYKLDVKDAKVTVTSGKTSVDIPAKVESVDQKFETTSVRYLGTEKPKITEIRIGGTKTKLVFND
jgi:hypothetical protein